MSDTFKDIKINIDKGNLPSIYFDIVFSSDLSVDIFRLKWDYDDASILNIEFEEEYSGRPLAKFINVEAEQAVVTKVLEEMKRTKWEPWDRWGFEEILEKRLRREKK